MIGAIAAAAVIGASVLFGLWRRWRGGALTPPRRRATGGDADRRTVVAEADLHAPLGRRATLVQFSSAFCAPCRATRLVLSDVAATVDGVVHVEVDAESRLELVRRLGILRTPTVLVLDAEGRVAARGAGRPRRADVVAALGAAIRP